MVLSMDRWAGKVALVSGASAGIGASICEHLVSQGINVVGLARRVERVEELAKKLKGKKGKLYTLKADMTIEEDILNAFEWTSKNVGPVSILINNAGVIKQTNLTNGETAKWKQIFDTNIMGLCIATREAVRIMKKHDIAGHIVHINSVLGHKILQSSDLNVYPASKFAVTALTEGLRIELADQKSMIKVTSVSPGLVKTDIAAANNYKFSKQHMERYDHQAILLTEDVSDAVLYVLSTPPHVQVHEMILKPLLGE